MFTMTEISHDPIHEMAHMRRAIYTALYPYFTTRALLDALWLWEEHYATGHSQTIRLFVDEITQGILSSSRINRMYHGMLANFVKHPDDLEEDPLDMMLAYRAGKLDLSDEVDVFRSKDAANTVFYKVLDNFMRRLVESDRYYALKVRQYALQVIFDVKLDIAQLKEIRQWLDYYDTRLELTYSLEQMRAILHILYMGAGEYFGPVVTDNTIREAVETVSMLPEAKKFNPQQLIEE